MEIYQLDYILHEPTKDHGWMYRAEAPALQGCVAWGDTPAETVVKMVDFSRKTTVNLLSRRGHCRAVAPTVQGGSARESHPGQPADCR